ncbi:MAG: type II toxin-antitoxin system RelE/ParE family toxin [Waddliaceae bacterium]
MPQYTIYETDDYLKWLETQTLKSRNQIQSRILKIEDEGHFGHTKDLKKDGIWEMKFNDGRRIYYVVIPESKIILLLGGNKNGQSKDINQAANILRKIIKDGSR